MTLPTITDAMANTYFATTPRQAAWAAVLPADQAIALTEAQTWLGQLCWNTTADCCGASFDASYTRAVSELALALNANPTALIGHHQGSAGTADLPLVTGHHRLLGQKLRQQPAGLSREELTWILMPPSCQSPTC